MRREPKCGGVAVDEQGQHHRGRILFGTGAALVNLDPAQVQRGDGIQDEVDEVIVRHPVAQIGRQEQRGVPVNGDETNSHAFQTRQLRCRSNPNKKNPALSPTGC